MPLTLPGLRRKSWKSLNSPCPTVAPNDAGWRSDMSKRNVFAPASATAVARVSGSEYAEGGTFLFGDEKPPRLAQIAAACGVARYWTSARAAGLSLDIAPTSPPPTTDGGELPTDGNGKTLKPLTGFAFVDDEMTPSTKSPSSTIAAFGGLEKTWLTEVGKSVCSAPCVPPAMRLGLSRTTAIV